MGRYLACMDTRGITLALGIIAGEMSSFPDPWSRIHAVVRTEPRVNQWLVNSSIDSAHCAVNCDCVLEVADGTRVRIQKPGFRAIRMALEVIWST